MMGRFLGQFGLSLTVTPIMRTDYFPVNFYQMLKRQTHKSLNEFQVIDGCTLHIGEGEERIDWVVSLEPRSGLGNDPIAYLAVVIRREIEVVEGDLSSLTNNILLVRILDVARLSAKTGKTVLLESSK